MESDPLLGKIGDKKGEHKIHIQFKPIIGLYIIGLKCFLAVFTLVKEGRKEPQCSKSNQGLRG